MGIAVTAFWPTYFLDVRKYPIYHLFSRRFLYPPLFLFPSSMTPIEYVGQKRWHLSPFSQDTKDSYMFAYHPSRCLVQPQLFTSKPLKIGRKFKIPNYWVSYSPWYSWYLTITGYLSPGVSDISLLLGILVPGYLISHSFAYHHSRCLGSRSLRHLDCHQLRE